MSGGKKALKTVSCAECRRLKLKCDRVFPCSSCRKRGCDALCPNGGWKVYEGTGALISNEKGRYRQDLELLKDRINTLTDRVRSLEDALQKLQTQVSSDIPHPLLSAELLAIIREGESKTKKTQDRKTSVEDRSSQELDENPELGDEEEVNDIKDALGTMALHPDGRSRFYGATATVESEFYDNEPSRSPERQQPSSSELSAALGSSALWSMEGGDILTDDGRHSEGLSPKNATATGGDSQTTILPPAEDPVPQPHWFATPLPPNQVAKVIARLEKHLPEYTKAWSLCETYFEHAAWLHSCITRKDFLADIFTPIYDPDLGKASLTRGPDSPPGFNNQPVLMERAAILFVAFAIGTLLDLTEPENHPPRVARAESYYDLACTALGVAGPAERGSINCVQCLLLMSFYQLLLDTPGSRQRSWAMIGLTANIAQCIGLHRDSAWWNNNAEDVQRRRDLFWELFAFERLQSITMGLPPSLLLEHIDCEFPRDLDETISSTGEVKHSALWSKKLWTRDILPDIMDVLVMTHKKPVPYSTILSLDRKLRDELSSKDLFADLSRGPMDAQVLGSPWTPLQAFLHVLVKETTIISLHRLPLSRALHGPMQNVFGSRYGPSVLASFRSACHIVFLHQRMATLDSALPLRLWVIWNHLLGAVIVLAALATKNPQCTIAPDALTQLDIAYELFKRAASLGAARPTKALKIVAQLRENAWKAYDAAQKTRSNPPQPPTIGPIVGTAPDVDQKLNDEVNVLFKSRRIMEIPEKRRSTSATTATTTTSSPSAFLTSQSPLGNEERAFSEPPTNIFDTVHPELMEDLRSSNKLNETRMPWLDWSFEGLASWNEVPADASALDAVYQPQGVVYDTSQMATLSAQNQMTAGGVALTLDAQKPFRDDMVLSTMESNQMMPDDLGLVVGGVIWDPAWQSLMDQLGIASHQTAME